MARGETDRLEPIGGLGPSAPRPLPRERSAPPPAPQPDRRGRCCPPPFPCSGSPDARRIPWPPPATATRRTPRPTARRTHDEPVVRTRSRHRPVMVPPPRLPID